jgi:uncharacterized membrane protein YbhN (UPF0104 family)
MTDRPTPGVPDRRRVLWGVARLFAVVIVVVVLIARLPGFGTVRARFSGADPGWIAISALLEAGSVASFVVAFHSAFAPRLRWHPAASIGMIAQGINVVVPAGGTGGLAAATVIMVRAGIPLTFSAGRMIALFLITAVATNLVLVVVSGLGVGLGVLPGAVSWEASLLPAFAAVLVVGALAALARRLPTRPPPAAGRWRSAVYRALAYLRDGLMASGELLRTRDPKLVLGALGYVLLDIAALAAAFRATGSTGLPVGPMLLAYTLGQIGSVISLPGTTEGGLIGVFVLYGASLSVATPAILLFRAVDSTIPLLLALLGLAGIRGALRQRAEPAGTAGEAAM